MSKYFLIYEKNSAKVLFTTLPSETAQIYDLHAVAVCGLLVNRLNDRDFGDYFIVPELKKKNQEN